MGGFWGFADLVLEEAGEGSPLLWCSAAPTPTLTTKSKKPLLRPVGRSLPDCCEAPAAALTPVVTAAAAASVAERERERDSWSWSSWAQLRRRGSSTTS